MKNFIVRFQGGLILFISARDRLDVLREIDEHFDPGGCLIAEYEGPIKFGFRAKVPDCERYDSVQIDPTKIPCFNFRKRCLKDEFSDLRVLCLRNQEPKEISAHSIVMSQYPFFEEVIVTSTDNSEGFKSIGLFKEVDIEHVEVILQWMYFPRCSIEDLMKGRVFYEGLEHSIEVIKLTKKVKLDALSKLLCQYFGKKLIECKLPRNSIELEQVEDLMKIWELTKGDEDLFFLSNMVICHLRRKLLKTAEEKQWRKSLFPEELKSENYTLYRMNKPEIVFRDQENHEYPKTYETNSSIPQIEDLQGSRYRLSNQFDVEQSFRIMEKILFPHFHKYKEKYDDKIDDFYFDSQDEQEVEEKKKWMDKRMKEACKAWFKEEESMDKRYERNRDACRTKLKNVNEMVMERSGCHSPELILQDLTNSGADVENYYPEIRKEMKRMERKCNHKNCEEFGAKTCSGCKKVYYCSTGCQKRDWKYHKNECKTKK